MTEFKDRLWRDLVQEHGPTLAVARRPQERAGLLRRPRVLAGSTLGLAGVAAALILALGGPATQPAFAITQNADGSVLVKLDYARHDDLPQVNAKLAAMGTHEQITIYMAAGPASVPGPVTCTRAPSATGPQVKVLDGPNGTEVIQPGESGGNTAEGTFHLDHCVVSRESSSGNTGNS